MGRGSLKYGRNMLCPLLAPRQVPPHREALPLDRARAQRANDRFDPLFGKFDKRIIVSDLDRTDLAPMPASLVMAPTRSVGRRFFFRPAPM